MAKPNRLQSVASQVAASMQGHDIDRIAHETATGRKVFDPKEPPGPPPKPEPEPEAPQKNSRAGKRFLGFYVNSEKHELVKRAALDAEIQIQVLLEKALDAWIEEHGQEAVEFIAQRKAKKAERSGN